MPYLSKALCYTSVSYCKIFENYHVDPAVVDDTAEVPSVGWLSAPYAPNLVARDSRSRQPISSNYIHAKC